MKETVETKWSEEIFSQFAEPEDTFGSMLEWMKDGEAWQSMGSSCLSFLWLVITYVVPIFWFISYEEEAIDQMN